MQFLKTLFWVVLAVILVLSAKANWNMVTWRLWGGLEADVKLPVLLFAAFLLGFVPTFLVYRARLWSLRRRLEPLERNAATVPPPVLAQPVTVGNGAGESGTGEGGAGESGSGEERVATDSKVWPTP